MLKVSFGKFKVSSRFYGKCGTTGPLRSCCTAAYSDILQQLNGIEEDNKMLTGRKL